MVAPEPLTYDVRLEGLDRVIEQLTAVTDDLERLVDTDVALARIADLEAQLDEAHATIRHLTREGR